MLPILAFDCSTHTASVALHVNGMIASHTIEHGKQAALLVPTIDALLKEHRVAYGDLAAIVTTLGPGSFTGLRIALATLHGLALAHTTPIKTLTSLEAVAWEVAQKPDAPPAFQIILDAGKGEVFVQNFMHESKIPIQQDAIRMIAPSEIDASLPFYGNTKHPSDPHYMSGPSASILCTLAEQLPVTAIEKALPLYIRAPDAKIPKKLAWLEETL